MGPYKIVFKPSVEKDLRGLPKTVVERAVKKIEDMRWEPLPSGCVRLEAAERLFRVRIGDYRVVYEVDGRAKLITIHYVRHRRDVYRRIR
ncbi:MAG: type II toxin-antitoxin system RelE/ParE family toxin [Acidobacteriia bacterium]|nr:type II toxin-antitoxin system RelE/ParE family toxin [Terriglobia bacterium]